MKSLVTVFINGNPVRVSRGTLVTSAVLENGSLVHRISLNGEKRGPLCGMGICFECSVSINQVAHIRACQTLCEEGMRIRTDE